MGLTSFFRRAWHITLIEQFRKEVEEGKRRGLSENEACGIIILRRWNLPFDSMLMNQAAYLAKRLGERDMVFAMLAIAKRICVVRELRAHFVCDPFFPRFGVLFVTALPFLVYSQHKLAGVEGDSVDAAHAWRLQDAASAAHFVTLIAPFEPLGWVTLAYFKALGVDHFDRFEEVDQLLNTGVSEAQAFLETLPWEETVVRDELQEKIYMLDSHSEHIIHLRNETLRKACC